MFLHQLVRNLACLRQSRSGRQTYSCQAMGPRRTGGTRPAPEWRGDDRRPVVPLKTVTCLACNTVATIDRSVLFVPGNVVYAFQRGWGGRWPRPPGLSFWGARVGVTLLAWRACRVRWLRVRGIRRPVPLRSNSRPQHGPVVEPPPGGARTAGAGNVEIRISRADLPGRTGPDGSPHDRWSPNIWPLRQLSSLFTWQLVP
jgi:hypothetical protein